MVKSKKKGSEKKSPNPVARPMRALKVYVDYSLSLAEMIIGSNYSWVHGDITPEHFPHNMPPVIVAVGICFLEIVDFAKTDEVVAELDSMGLRPATLPELLALWAQFPRIHCLNIIIALGSSMRNSKGSVVRPVINGDASPAELTLRWDDPDRGWASGSFFAAVRK